MSEQDWDPVDGFAFNVRTNIIHIIVSDFLKKLFIILSVKLFYSFMHMYMYIDIDTNTYKHVFAYNIFSYLFFF